MLEVIFLRARKAACVSLLAIFSILFSDTAVLAGEVRGGAGLVSGGQNAASVLSSGQKAIEVMRYALEVPAKTMTTSVASKVTSLIGTIGFFAADVATDEDAFSGYQTVIEIHQAEELSGIQGGSAGHYARKAGFTDEEFAELLNGK